MKTESKVLMLRASYWIGAILDAIYAFNMSLVWLIDGYSGFDPMRLIRFTEGLESRYAWGMACVLMASWTILLIWADRKPVERKGVVMLTALPLVAGLLIDTLFATIMNLVPWVDMLPLQLSYIFLILLFIFSYLLAKTIQYETDKL